VVRQCSPHLVSIGIVVGLATEARLARRLGWPVAIGGGTTGGATAAAHSLLARGVTGLISCGLAGALDPSLRPGDVLIPDTVIDGHQRFSTDPELSRLLAGPSAHCLLAATAIVASAEQKRRLWRETGAAAVDLESGTVARVATGAGLPFAVLRVVCDPAERSLPPAALIALDAHGSVGVRRVLASIATHPGQLPTLLRLAADAAAAKHSLRTCVNRIVRSRV
jgi:adenosylhomocysteine nucleosidase